MAVPCSWVILSAQSEQGTSPNINVNAKGMNRFFFVKKEKRVEAKLIHSHPFEI